MRDHVAHLSERGAFETLRAGTCRMHRAMSRRLSLLDHIIDDRRFIGNGIRVRHRTDISEAAMRCRSGAGLDGLLVFEPGIAQMNVHVHEPWEG